MNDVLQLRGTFQQRPNGNRPGSRNVPKNSQSVTSDHLKQLIKDLQDLSKYWDNQKLITGALIDVNYIRVVAKSNRISGYFTKGTVKPNDLVRGARFTTSGDKKHIITHYVSDGLIKDTIEKVENTAKILDSIFSGTVSNADIENIDAKGIKFADYGLSKSVFLNIIVDSYYVQSFSVPDNTANATNNQIVTIYKTDEDTIAIMKNIGINITPDKIIDNTTFLLYPDEINLLKSKAPYLIAMAVEDITKLSLDDIVTKDGDKEHIPAKIDSPTNEPTIGVIDTLFDDRVYFAEWVDFRNMVDPNIPVDQDDFRHGTAVSSIIVDGHVINPDLDDGCGRFRVRHFGVATNKPFSSFTVVKQIKQIVDSNPDLRVWNLSLGSEREINQNFISPEAAMLDEIQFNNDVIFVIAGTNNNTKTERLIGSPADSINSIVVNSVNKTGNRASYSRKGVVLSFFNKPDVSALGGDGKDRIRVCEPTGEAFMAGTSFAAPWVSRKVAYLMEVLGLSREVAKALIVDAAADWNDTGNDPALAPFVGHGAVPVRIEDIVRSKDDEIKFIMSGVSEQYDTYTYNLPVPLNKDKHPFVTKATLCYFPNCSINQGVDYTNTELDISIGRMTNKGIKPIDKNMQSVNDGKSHYIYESDARSLYRKWDNTKHIREKYGDRLTARKAYKDGLWGVSVKTKERLSKRDGNGIKFGLVVTLKETSGINRINDFIRQAQIRGWLVNRIDVNAQVDIYNKLQEQITFDS
ncbi:S8 family peptidase [Acidithrix ferrooxidans]|uniref:Subtilase family protein n=1 Tax=Acidithrix ferrooxidans TaxID=1280514 RepID=A0A0D8HJE1_9ACTN|nr:S8 family peptidase [Acidithrix ferrooxidans]KJF18058.1 subtilase family protein [Acidithrix ferrooxidans]